MSMQTTKTPLVELTEGWTKEVGPFTLLADDVPMNLIGLTVDLLLRPWARTSGAFVEATGDVRVAQLTDVLASGQVYYKPDASDLSAAVGQYAAKWRVTDGNGDVVYFPNAEADLIVVYPS